MSEDNEYGFEVTDEFQVDDLSTQTAEDVLEPVRGVPFVIRKATIRTQLENNKFGQADDNKWLVKRLALQVAIGPEGTDGEGRYAKKVMFPELPLAFNTQEFATKYGTEYYQKRARVDTKGFFNAIGLNPAKLPAINDEFLTGLVGQEFTADITRKERRAQDGDGEWQGTGEFRNEIKNYKAIAAEAVSA